MKKIVFITGILLILAGILVLCDKPKSEGSLLHKKTELGGCNLKNDQKSNDDLDTRHNDTVIINVSKESVHVFVGINYTCKTEPFETKIEIIDDVLHMYIIDAGGDYMRCICYYTFDFIFKRDSKTTLNQRYKILLFDRNKEYVLISEGVINE